MSTFEKCNSIVKTFEESIEAPIINKETKYLTGVDLGTAFIVITVLDENYNPLCGAYKYASVVRDGLVVDYIGAIRIVKELKAQIEDKLGCELIYAATAFPPGTATNDAKAIKNVVESAGFEVTNMLDEPTAANSLLEIKNGAIVDIGGGSTGIAIFQDGKVVYVADEPTGGTHFSLILSGAHKISFDEAEIIKRDFKRHEKNFLLIRPAIQKVASIIKYHIKGYEVNDIYLVGGTCCYTGLEHVIEKETGIETHKPSNPMFVTPIGIAMNCGI